jgi:hypothetical protein
MKTKKESKKQDKACDCGCNDAIIYKCEKCGYENAKTFLSIFESEEYRYCLKCVNKFYETNFPKAVLKK